MPTCPVASAPASRLRGAPEPLGTPWPQFPSPDSGQLRSHHVPLGSGSRHQASRQLWDRHVPHGLQLMPPGSGQLRSYHVSRGWAQHAVSY
jgi:hypothetical protein